jgi:hypothetical protein
MEDHTLHEKIRLKHITKKLDGTMLNRLIWLSIVTDGLCEYGNETLVPIYGEFLD